MKRRPSILVVLAAVLVAIAVSMPLQIMKIYGHGFDELPAILLKLTYLNWLTIGAQLVTACLVLEASERLRYAVPVAIILVAVNNFFVGFHATDFSPWTATLATFAAWTPVCARRGLP